MKRFVWLLLIAFCSALAQEQPVAASMANQAKCDCCEDQAGACEMPDCLPQPAASPAVALEATATQQAEAGKLTRAKRERFYVQFLPRPALTPAATMSASAASPASVPLFRAHCSYLI
jgi:hypothetical protein